MSRQQVGTTGKVIDPRGVEVAKHYNNHPSGVEVKQVTSFMMFNCGNAFKYVIRRGEKPEHGLSIRDAVLKDLDKALWYLREQSTVEPPPRSMFVKSARDALDQMYTHENDPYIREFMLAIGDYCIGGYRPRLYDAQSAVHSLRDAVAKIEL